MTKGKQRANGKRNSPLIERKGIPAKTNYSGGKKEIRVLGTEKRGPTVRSVELLNWNISGEERGKSGTSTLGGKGGVHETARRKSNFRTTWTKTGKGKISRKGN